MSSIYLLQSTNYDPKRIFNSSETQFIFLIHKTLLSFPYFEVDIQKIILDDIKVFIQKLTNLFSNSNNINPQEKRSKIIEVLVKYLDRYHNTQFNQVFIRNQNEDILFEIEKDAYQSTLSHLSKNNPPKTQEKVNKKEDDYEIEYVNDNDDLDDSSISSNTSIKSVEDKLYKKILECKKSIQNIHKDIDKKIELKINSLQESLLSNLQSYIQDYLNNNPFEE